MKMFCEMFRVGHAKWVVNYHDGEKTHKDGSAFYDIAIFHSKWKKDAFVKKLEQEGYHPR